VSRGRWTLLANAGLGSFLSIALARIAWAAAREALPGEALWLVAADTIRTEWRAIVLAGLLFWPFLLVLLAPLARVRECAGSRGLLAVLAALALFALGAVGAWVRLHPPSFDAVGRSGLDAPANLRDDSFDFVAADLDGDRDPDLLVNHHNLHAPAVFRNRGDGTFEDAPLEFGLLDLAEAGDPFGEPPLEGGAGEMRVWHDWPSGPGRIGCWRIDWRPGASHHGIVRTDAEILRCEAVGEGVRAQIEDEGSLLRFSAEGIDRGSLAFETRWLEGSYEFDLLVGGDRRTSSIRIGRRGRPPPTLPFPFRLTDRHGAAVADFDGDGRTDVYFACGARLGRLAPPDPGKEDLLFLNAREGRFTLAEGARGASDPYGRGRSCSWVDLDGDGAGELYVTDATGPNRLYRRTEEGRFEEAAALSGVALTDRSAFEFLDLDEDGDLDLLAAPPVTVLRNEGGRFSEIPGRMGLPPLEAAPEASRGVFPEPAIAAEDTDGDGDLDLFLGDRFYRREGDGFHDFTEAVGLEAGGRVGAAAFGDFDNDGDRDLYVSRATGPGRLYRNEGGRFRDVTRGEGVHRSRRLGLAAGWLDADGDGFLDLFRLYRSVPDLWASLAGSGAIHDLFRNRANGNGWIAFDLQPDRPIGSAHGTRVEVRTTSGVQVRVAGLPDRTVHSRGRLPLHFGLGGDRDPTSVEIRWPSGRVQALEGVRGGRVVRVDER
jgi:hypothetical protein